MDPGLVNDIFAQKNNDLIQTDFQLKELYFDFIATAPPHAEDLGHTGEEPGLHTEKYEDLELQKNESTNSKFSKISTDADHDFTVDDWAILEEIVEAEEEKQMGRDITEEELSSVVNDIRKKIKEEGDVDEDKYINIQYMNDMLLLQTFIGRKVEKQKIRDFDEEKNLNINDFKEFPTLGKGMASGGTKKKKAKIRHKKEPPCTDDRWQPPPQAQKEDKDINIIKTFEENYEKIRQRDDEEGKRLGLVGGTQINPDHEKVNNFDILKSSNAWSTFEKNFFVKGSVRILSIC